MRERVPNQLLRDARMRLFGTQAALADAANQLLSPAYLLTANHIGKIERGVVERPNALRCTALRTVCGVSTDADIGLVRHRTPTPVTQSPVHVINIDADPRGAAAKDPQILRVGGYVVVDQQSERLPPPAASPPLPIRFDGSANDWDSFLTMTRLLASQRQAVAPAALLSLVEAHRDSLWTLFRKAQADPLRAHIGAMVAEASIVASRLWSAQGNRAMALAHCAHARVLADDLHNPALAATARIFESNLHSDAATLIGASGDVITGLRILDEAAHQESTLSPAARARLAAEQAQAFAVLKLPRECKQALGRARAAADQINDADRTGLFSDWSPTRLQVYVGTCWLLLGEPYKAVTLLEDALHDMANDQENVNVALAARVDLASAYAETGDLDHACSMVASTYEQLIGIGNRRGVERAEQARGRLRRWDCERPVRELDERMASIRAA
jgi:hypothetical protein